MSAHEFYICFRAVQRHVPEVQFFMEQAPQKRARVQQLPLCTDFIQFLLYTVLVLPGQNRIDPHGMPAAGHNRQCGDDQIAARRVLQKTADRKHVRDQKLFLKCRADIIHKLPRKGVIGFHYNRAGDALLILLIVFKKRAKMERNKRDLIFIKCDLVNFRKFMGEKNGHIINRRIILF